MTASSKPGAFTYALQRLKEKSHYQWILLDLPHGAAADAPAYRPAIIFCPL
jgi:hypothetical protein